MSESDCSVSTSSSFGCLEDRFTFDLRIECDPPLPSVNFGLAGEKSKVTKIERGPIYSYSPEGEPVELADPQLESVAFPHSSITLTVKRFCDDQYLCQTYNAKNGAYFTVQDLVDVLVQFELIAREHRRIGGMIDLTHVQFEGLLPGEDDSFEVQYE